MNAHVIRAVLLACLLGWSAASTHGLGQAGAVPELKGLSAENAGSAIFVAADQRASGYGDMQVDLKMVLRNSRGVEAHRELRISQLEVPEDGDKLLVVF